MRSAMQSASLDLIGLSVAGLELWLDARDSGLRMAVPACHAPFVTDGAARGRLTLEVRHGPLRSTEGWRPLFYDPETWQLWVDGVGRHVFVASSHSPPPRQIAVDAAFGSGEVVGEFGANGASDQALYPLRDIDMVLYANWLAQSGDLLLHAAGVDDAGSGYAFVGAAGAGKSTLAGQLASRPSVTVLGEDQVILRYLEGRFWIYGTPWHLDPAMCSPRGVPLRKLFFLDRANDHRIESCGPRAGIERLLPEALIPYYNRAGVERILDTLPRLVERVPLYTLGFQIGADVIGLIRDA